MFRQGKSPSMIQRRPRTLVALCVPTAVIFALTGCELSYNTSACVNYRCNVTVHGDQGLDLSGADGIDDVKVSNIGSGSATFTADGDTVTLRARETKQVGQSTVHLTSVEDNVAEFSIDFTSHFVDRSELEKVIADGLTADTGQRPKAVTCPVDLKAVEGATARCQLETSDGTASGSTVTVTSLDGDIVNFHFEVDGQSSADQ